jgi:hypothetical protein
MAEQQSLVLQVVPPRSASNRDIAALETVMQGLALGARHPVALEIARTVSGRQFLLRATSPAALEHLAAQVQARYPQAIIQPFTDDPLIPGPEETVTAVELHPGAASYLPLRSWRERELPVAGTDPLLGLLAAVSHVPTHMRVVAQLALLPLSPTWSQGQRRRAVEHPLEPERQRQRRGMTTSGSSAPSTAGIIAMGMLVALLLLWSRFSKRLPPWIVHAGSLLLHGKNPHLSSSQTLLLVIGLLGIATAILLGLFMINWLLRRLSHTSIYDMRLVAEKTGRSAYRARLRLFVITAREAAEAEKSEERPVEALQERHLSFTPNVQDLSLAHIKSVFQHWRHTLRRRHQRIQAQEEVLERLTSAYRQYHTASGGYFVPRRLSGSKARRLLMRRTGLARLFTGWERGLRQSRHMLSVADIAVLWHLPQSSDLPDLPLLERGRARTFLAPFELTTGYGWRIGSSTHAGHSVPVYLPATSLHHNLLAVASTGKGKSTLFLHLARAIVSAGAGTEGLFVMEPHRELIETLIGLIPQARQDDVVLVDVADRMYPPGINPLDATLGRDRDKTVDNLITIFERIWLHSWGPRTENVLEFSLKTLADANESIVKADLQQGPDRQYTLLDVVPLLRNTSFRHAVMEQVTDPALLSWWRQYYEPMDLRFQMEVISSVLNKMSKFSSSRTTRRILGQPRSTINFTDIIRSGKILLVSTASGVVGTDVAALLGATLLGLFHLTLAEQAELQREQRQRFLALIDEFQVFLGADFGAMLAELRKYGGSFGLATQSFSYLDRLDRTLRSAVLANVDHLFAFAMSGEDARLLHELDGIEEDDITTLDDFTCYTRLSLDGRRLPVFSLRLDAPPIGDREQTQRIRMRSQQRYARPCDAVDAMIAQAIDRHATRTFPSRTGTRDYGQLEESLESKSSNVQDSATARTAGQPARSSRQKRRGSGKAPTEANASSLSMPLVYELRETAGGEERDGL